jgi:hypothetical protein
MVVAGEKSTDLGRGSSGVFKNSILQCVDR